MAVGKEIRTKISSIQSTQKITSAMKLVAASKLRRAQEQAEAARPFAQRMASMLANLAKAPLFITISLSTVSLIISSSPRITWTSRRMRRPKSG